MCASLLIVTAGTEYPASRTVMEHPGFFHRAGPFTLQHIAEASGAENVNAALSAQLIGDVRPLHLAGEGDLTFFENRKYLPQLRVTQATACILDAGDLPHAPGATAVLTSKKPYQSFARVLRLFYADALRTKTAGSSAMNSGGLVHSSARFAEGVIVEPGAVIGREATLGEGTVIAAGAVVGYRVVIGRDCYIGPNSTITHSIIGDGVIIHGGVRIGQDGFGFAMSSQGHLKIPQIGRVLIGDDVEIGANSTVDRGSLTDTIIGSGTKIDNLVQIAHNVVIGKNCIIVAQSGIAGSAELGDGVIMGAHSGVVGHIKIGRGAQIAGAAHVKDDLEPGARVGGTPARPFREWAREIAALRLLAKKS